jgi:hypothetical protein
MRSFAKSAALAVAAAICASAGGFAARADVWVAAASSLDRVSASGAKLSSLTKAFGSGISPRKTLDLLEVDPRDGSVWFYDENTAGRLTGTGPFFNVWRLLHVSRDGVPLTQFGMLGATGLALDPIRGGIWVAWPEGRTDPAVLDGGRAELRLLDLTTGAVKARIRGFDWIVDDILLGADGALWVQHWSPGSHWTRLDGTVAQLDGYRVTAATTGPRHRHVDLGARGSAAAVDRRDGSVWVGEWDVGSGPSSLVKLSPDGSILKSIVPRNLRTVSLLAVHSRNGSVWLGDSTTYTLGTRKINLAHYSALGTELGGTNRWAVLNDLALDMTDASPWAVVRYERDEDAQLPAYLVKLDSSGRERPGISQLYASGVRGIAGYELPSTTAMIAVDVAPSDRQNRVDPAGTGVVAVALLSSATLNATRVLSDTLRFGTSGAVSRARWTRDVNGDGRLDFVHQFRIADTGLKCGDTQAPLTAKLPSGRNVYAVGAVTTVGGN